MKTTSSPTFSGAIVVCRSNGTRLRRHPPGVKYDSSDDDYWASKIEVDEVALVLDWRTGSAEVDLYVLGPRGPGWIWAHNVQLVSVGGHFGPVKSSPWKV